MGGGDALGLALALGAAWAARGRDALAVLVVGLVVMAFFLGGR